MRQKWQEAEYDEKKNARAERYMERMKAAKGEKDEHVESAALCHGYVHQTNMSHSDGKYSLAYARTENDCVP